MYKIIAAILTVAAVALAAWLALGPVPRGDVERYAAASPASAVSGEPPTRVAAPGAAPPPSGTDAPPRAYRERLEFHERARTFFAQAAAMRPDEREAHKRAIEQELTRYEQAGEVAAAEALLLRMALIRETVPDEAAQRTAMAALQERYRAESRRRAAETARPDPAFEQYKAREREIVLQVQAMTTIPDGLTRDEYLRRRLQQERELLLGSR